MRASTIVTRLMISQNSSTASYRLLKNTITFLQMTMEKQINYLKRDMYMISNTDILLCLIIEFELNFALMTYT